MKNLCSKFLACLIAVALVFSSSATQLPAFDVKAAEIKSESVSAPTKGSSGYVNDDYVNLRSGAGTNYSVVECMRKNTTFTFVDGKLYNTNWYKIKLTSNSKVGYAHKSYLSVTSSSSSSSNDASATSTSGYISEDYVNLRSGAGTNYSILVCMRKSTEFTLVSKSLYNTNWYKIKLKLDSTVGYVHKDYVKINSSSGSSSSGNTNNSSQNKLTTGFINADFVNLRSGAGTNYSAINCLRINTVITFVTSTIYNSGWYNIKLDDGTIGYVFKDYVTANTSDSTSVGTNSGGLTISASSKTLYKGNNYVLYVTGGTSLKWSSSNTAVATVDSRGVVTAKNVGTTTITVVSGLKFAKCTITVKAGSSVNITSKSIKDLRRWKSVLLKSSTNGVKWETSNSNIATVNNGVVYAKNAGVATITAYTSTGAASCLISIIGRDNIRFTYATPNSAPLNSTVQFKTITDTDRTDVYFIVTNGTTSYKVAATQKVKDGNNYIWTGSKKLDKSGKWTVTAYSKFKTSTSYLTTPGGGEGEAFITASTDATTPVCAERRASDAIIDLIADYEGFLPNLTADYITSDPTVGYGRVIWEGDQFYNNLTKNEAYAYLCQTVNEGGYTKKTNSFLLDNNVKFNQRQFDSLVCFAYNVGASAIYNDSELRAVLLNSKGTSGSITAGKSGYVNTNNVNLRSGAGTSYSVVTTMSINTKFTFVDGTVYNSNWYKIKLSDGRTGYIYKTYASVTGSSSSNLNDVKLNDFVSKFCSYHHAAGDCYYGLLYRRIDETEIFFYGDYLRDGQNNKYGIKFYCYNNSSFGMG